MQVHDHLLNPNFPDTFITGYNFTEFDNKILQHLFYRNGIDPYMHQYKNGNTVGDLYAFVRLVFARNRDAIIFPDLDGKPSLKLDRMVPANKIVVEGAYHDALTDCHATFELLKILIKNSPSEWEDFCESLNKFNIERSLKQSDKATEIAFHNDPFYGKARSFTKPFYYLNDARQGQFTMVNLLAPLQKYIDMGAKAYKQLESEKKFNEIERMFITPFYSSKPIFSVCDAQTYKDKFKNCILCFEDLLPNLSYVNDNYSLVDEFFREYQELDEGFDSSIKDVDEIELGKFISSDEKRYFSRIHDEIASKTIEAKMVLQGGSERARKLMGRLLMRNDIVAISDSTKRKFFSKKLSEKINNKTDRTLDETLARINKIRVEKELDAEQIALMDSLERYLINKKRMWID